MPSLYTIGHIVINVTQMITQTDTWSAFTARGADSIISWAATGQAPILLIIHIHRLHKHYCWNWEWDECDGDGLDDGGDSHCDVGDDHLGGQGERGGGGGGGGRGCAWKTPHLEDSKSY